MGQSVQHNATETPRSVLVRRGLLLVAASITWMVVEGAVSVGAGLAAGSVALLAFGIDSFIELASVALRTDACEAVCCAWLSAATLGGLLLNALFGWWWADPVAALVLVPLLVREGLAGWREGSCACEERTCLR